jgi:hypothetical protein
MVKDEEDTIFDSGYLAASLGYSQVLAYLFDQS